MRRFLRTSAVLLAAAWAIPAPAYAAEEPAGDDETIVDDSDDETIIDDSEMDGDVEAGGDAPAGDAPAGDAAAGGDKAAGDSGGDGGLFGEQPKDLKKDSKPDPESEARQIAADKAFITVVQRQRFLKKKRFEIMPQIGITANDPFVRHYVVGAELNYWITNRLAVGLNGNAFFGAKTSRYNNIRSQQGLLLTANKAVWQASAAILYNPFYGKIAVFNRALLHWEAYVQLGGGLLQSQVIPRYEVLHEPFNNFNPQGNFAIGARFYAPKIDWVSFNFGVRTWLYPDKLEPAERGPNIAGGDIAAYDAADVAKANAVGVLGSNVVAFFGVSFYLPTTFEYTTRR